MNEQKFRLELERFTQKASWENKIFYTFLGFMISVILFYIQQGKVGENDFWYWVGGLGILLILGEFLVHRYLDTQMQKIKNEIKEKK